jgi:hypothetical protein
VCQNFWKSRARISGTHSWRHRGKAGLSACQAAELALAIGNGGGTELFQESGGRTAGNDQGEAGCCSDCFASDGALTAGCGKRWRQTRQRTIGPFLESRSDNLRWDLRYCVLPHSGQALAGQGVVLRSGALAAGVLAGSVSDCLLTSKKWRQPLHLYNR